MMAERCRDLAHVGAVELFTPVLADSTAFFVDLLGMSQVDGGGSPSS
jgi:catechol 2,3-dioxygenase